MIILAKLELTKMQSDLYSIIAAMLSDVYQHNIGREISLSTWSLLALRLQLYQRFEEWRQQLDPRLRLITPQEICTVLTSQIEENRFRITLTVHYYRALIMLNGPVIKNLLDIVVNSSRADEADESLFEQCVPTIKSDLVVLENLNHILCIISQSEEFMNHNNVRWISNHACKDRRYTAIRYSNTNEKQVQY
jgi:hypothetical protein